MISVGSCLRRGPGLVAAVMLLLVACGARTPEQLMAAARHAADAHEMRTAEIHLKNLLQQQPNDAAARALLGQVSLAEGDAATAEESFRRALELGSDPGTIQLPLLQALLAQGKYQEVLDQIKAGPSPKDADRLATLALTATANRGLKQFDAAEAAYRVALEIDPHSLPARTDLASLYFQTGRRDEGNRLVAAVLADQTDFVPALALRAAAQITAGDYAAAEASFVDIVSRLKSKPSTAEYRSALYQLGEVHLVQRKIDEANANADELLALAPKNPTALYLKARVEIEQGKDSDAERRLERVVADFPEYWLAYTALGIINSKQDQLGQAQMYLRTAVNNNPDDRNARLLLAQLYIRQGDTANAKQLLSAPGQPTPSDSVLFALAARENQRAGNTDAAAQYFARSEQNAPDNLRDLVGLSNVYMSSGEFERAIRVLQSSSLTGDKDRAVADYLLVVAQLNDRDVAGARTTVERLAAEAPPAAWLSNLRGTVALLSRDIPAAGDFFAAALKLDPKFTPALLNSARVALLTNRPNDAEASFKRVLEVDAQPAAGVDPQHAAAMLGLAALAASRRDFAAAKDWLERLPASPDRLRLEGQIAAAEGRFADSASAFSQAFSQQPSAELALAAYAVAKRANREKPDAELLAFSADHPSDPRVNFALGSIALEGQDDDAAIKRFDAVLEADPKNVAALNNLAWLYDQRGDRRGLDLAKRAYDLEPGNPSVADTLGWIHVRAGRAVEALPLLEQAAAKSKDPEIRYHWAVALADQGDGAKARGILQALLASNADFPSRRDAEKRLKGPQD
jgi:putative PEP-CTERM system TPR-repeat lipoprotein